MAEICCICKKEIEMIGNVNQGVFMISNKYGKKHFCYKCVPENKRGFMSLCAILRKQKKAVV